MITKIDKYTPIIHRQIPYKHQSEVLERSRDSEYFALFWEMGCGKTKVVIDTSAWLFNRGEIDGVLILADKGVYLNWYYDEIPIHMPEVIPYRMAYWSAYLRSVERSKFNAILTAKDDMLDMLIMNIEALSSSRGVEAARTFLEGHYAMMVVDESTSIKNGRAIRTKATQKLGALAPYRRIMTGTPITQGPLDLFSQCEFLKRGCLGYHSYVAFRATYALMVQVVMGRQRFMKVAGYQNLDDLKRKILPFSSRILKSECLDLPPKVYETIYVEQTPEQERIYGELCEQALSMLNGEMITATNALTIALRLYQVNCGHVKSDDDVIIDVPSNRVGAVMSLLENHEGKAIIWCNFQRDVELMAGALIEAYGEGSVAILYGPVPQDERLDALSRFHNHDQCRWFVGTQQTGGKGLTLTEASLVIYYSNSYKLELRLQSEDRAHRIGQRRTVTYIDLVVPKTVDVKVVKALRSKRDLASEILDNPARALAEIVTPDENEGVGDDEDGR